MEQEKSWIKYLLSMTRDDALNLFEELYTWTYEFVINNDNNLRHIWPPSSAMPQQYFNPKGIVIHHSNSPSMWNSLYLLCRNIYSSHVLILSNKHFVSWPPEGYDYLSNLPSMALMPNRISTGIQHAGWLSRNTFGIDLRNVGRLRPFISDLTPFPILPIEEELNAEKLFRYNVPNSLTQLDMYTQYDLWRTKFGGAAYNWYGYYYEIPTVKQIKTMLIIIKAMILIMDEYDSRLLIPNNCVTGTYPNLPILPMSLIRRIVEITDYEEAISLCYRDNEWLYNLFFDYKTPFEGYDLDENETSINEHITRNRWRGESDDGNIDMLFADREFEAVRLYEEHLNAIGYKTITTEDLNFAMQMYAIGQKIGLLNENDIYAKINRESAFRTTMRY